MSYEKSLRKKIILLTLGLVLLTGPARRVMAAADDMSNFCSIPPFVLTSVTPNLLMMLDNSASMYDLEYIDKGNGNLRTPTYCYDQTYKSTTPGGYPGYFKTGTYYDYNFAGSYFTEAASFPADATCTKTLAKITNPSNTLFVCYDPATKSVSRFVALGSYLNWMTMSKFDVEKQILTGGKYDATSQILTPETRGCVGRKFIKQPLDQDYVEYTPPAADPNLSHRLGITFAVSGPTNQYNASAPSPGGQAYIDIFVGTYNAANCQKAINDFQDTSIQKQTLIDDIGTCIGYSATGSSSTCKLMTSKSCNADTDCYSTTTGVCSSGIGACGTLNLTGTCSVSNPNGISGICSVNNGTSCSKVCVGGTNAGNACSNDGNCPGGTCGNGKVCVNGGKQGAACNNVNDCAFSQCTQGNTSLSSCSANSQCDLKKCGGTGMPMDGTKTCTSENDCSYGLCTSGKPNTTHCTSATDCSTAVCTAGPNLNAPCTTNAQCNTFVGPCMVPTTTQIKSTYAQNMHTCYQLLYKGQAAPGQDDLNIVNGNNGCNSIYSSYYTCKGGSLDGASCTVATQATDCPGGGVCINGPGAIRPGSPVLICGYDYAGYCAVSSDNWNTTTWVSQEYPTSDDCISAAIVDFCNTAQVPNVTDPTENASATPNYANLPAILSDTGIGGQLGDPIAELPVRAQNTTEPKGLVQQFNRSIRMGAMAFNILGSPSECTTAYPPPVNSVPCPKVCSSDPTVNCGSKLDCPFPATATCDVIASFSGTKYCYKAGSLDPTSTVCDVDTDCGVGQTCMPNNKDGAEIIHYIGWGTCYNTATKTQVTGPVRCAIDAHCALDGSQYCQSDGVGDHSSGLINTIDGIKGASWTPFAEALYDAIGYYAKNSGDSTGRTSRTDLRINTGDFNANYNPSQARCQANNVLLITDGMSTADQNGYALGNAVWPVVNTYRSVSPVYTNNAAGIIDGKCPAYSGSTWLENLSWLANNRNISLFLRTSASTTAPSDLRDRITTYGVFNGASNNGTGDCDSQTMLTNTAANGGTSVKIATNPTQLSDALQRAMQEVANKAASGSAVSVLTTSSRGVGSMLQAYFYPTSSLNNNRQLTWLGYTQNLWIDPVDQLRDDYSTGSADKHLVLDQDHVMKLNTDPISKSTKVGLFTTLSDGTGGSLASCQTSSVVDFGSVIPIWEAGKKLAQTNPDNRNIFTAIPGAMSMGTPGGAPFTVTNVSAFSTYLNPETAPGFTDTKIVRYTRGEALESAATYSTLYGSSGSNSMFRDRTMDVCSADNSQGCSKSSDCAGSQSCIAPTPPNIGPVWKLGDVINSTPKVVGNIPQNTYFIDYGDVSYYNFVSSDAFLHRSSLAIIGSNDGMLHAFRLGYLKDKKDVKGLLGQDIANLNTKALFRDYYDASDGANSHVGEEAWAYIPYNLLPYLKYYASSQYPSCHIYGIDLSIKIYDVSIGVPTDGDVSANGTGSAKDWRTILIGGMRFGGACKDGQDPTGPPLANTGFSSYFALDLTDYLTESGTTLTPADLPTPLWEFTDDDLGYTTSSPAIVRTGSPSQNGKWYVVLGSGSTQLPKSSLNQDVDRNKTGFLYILDLKTGSLVKKIGLGHNAIVSDLLAIDADKNYTPEKVYFGTSYTNAGSWAGKIMSLAIQPDNSTADITTLCGTGTGPFFTCSNLTTLFSNNYPFTASPDATRDEMGNIWIYAGSGKYYSTVDEQDHSQQVFVGLIDKGTTVSAPSPAASCPGSCSSATTLCDVTKCTTTAFVPTQGGTTQVCIFNGQTSSFQDVVTSVNNATTNTPRNSAGWILFLDDKERVISRPLAAGGVVDFLSYVPNSDLCNKGGTSYLYAVDYQTGAAPTNVAIRALNATTDISGSTGQAGKVRIERRVNLGLGAPPSGEAIIITPPKEGQDKLKKKIQVSTGVIVESENKPVLSTVSKILNWLKK